MRTSVGQDPNKDVGKLYNIIARSLSSLVRAKNLPEPSVVFSVEPANRREELLQYVEYYSGILGWLSFLVRLPFLPSFQVIDCRSRAIITWPIDTKPPYLTLSYVWGEGGHDNLTTLVEDFISVTTGLRYQYLWVDRYCIPQIDAAAKEIQIRNMNYVYQHSVLTIIAASGDNPSYGLPGVSKRSRTKHPSVTIKNTTLVPLLSDGADNLRRSTWNTRRWTYQEGLLSRRSLIFTDSQVHFQCRVMDCSEGFSLPLEALHTLNKQRFRTTVITFPMSFISRGASLRGNSFATAATHYAQRNLTCEKDGLNAFKGVLEEFRNPSGNAKPMRNYFGIPLY
ncbi:HET-domain-containing protein [Xylariaceae sp. AK1471]|nr:HET-domain-containing protein [Xylariaceae sp. AK1471]